MSEKVVPEAVKTEAKKGRRSKIASRHGSAAAARSRSTAPKGKGTTEKANPGAVTFSVHGSAAMVKKTSVALLERTDIGVKMYEYGVSGGRMTFKVAPSAVSKATKAVLISVPGMRAKIVKSGAGVSMEI